MGFLSNLTKADKYATATAAASLFFAFNPLAFLGPVLKKVGTPKDGSGFRNFGFGLLATILGGPGGLLSYFIASPSKERRDEVHSARSDATAGRYDNS